MDEFLSATVRGLAQGSLYTLLGLGFVIIYKGTRVVNFAQPVLMILGAYWTSYFVITSGMNFWLGVLVAVVVTALIAAVVERIALRPMVGEPPFSAPSRALAGTRTPSKRTSYCASEARLFSCFSETPLACGSTRKSETSSAFSPLRASTTSRVAAEAKGTCRFWPVST